MGGRNRFEDAAFGWGVPAQGRHWEDESPVSGGGVPQRGAESVAERAPSSTFRTGGRERAPFQRHFSKLRLEKTSSEMVSFTFHFLRTIVVVRFFV